MGLIWGIIWLIGVISLLTKGGLGFEFSNFQGRKVPACP